MIPVSLHTAIARATLSTSAEALVHEWNAALATVQDDALAGAIADLGTAISIHIRTAGEVAPIHIDVVNGRVVAFIDFPPFTELAMREVIDAIHDVGLLERRIATIQEMARMLGGRA